MDNVMDPAQAITRMQAVENLEHKDIEWPVVPGIDALKPEEQHVDLPVIFFILVFH